MTHPMELTDDMKRSIEDMINQMLAAGYAALGGLRGDVYVCGEYEATRIEWLNDGEYLIIRTPDCVIHRRVDVVEGVEPSVDFEVTEQVEDGIWQVTVYDNE